MTSYVTFAATTGYTDGPATFAVVYDDDGFEYVWAKDIEAEFDAEDRLEIVYPDGEPEDLTANDYLEASLFNVGDYQTSQPEEFDNRTKAVKYARNELKKDTAEREKLQGEFDSGAEGLRRASDGWVESGEDVDRPMDEEETLLFMYDALSPIDPDGPNGWLLRIVQGEEPRPGDENGFVVFGAEEGVSK